MPVYTGGGRRGSKREAKSGYFSRCAFDKRGHTGLTSRPKKKRDELRVDMYLGVHCLKQKIRLIRCARCETVKNAHPDEHGKRGSSIVLP